MVEWLFLAVPWGCLQFVIVVFLIILTIFVLHLQIRCDSLLITIPVSLLANEFNVGGKLVRQRSIILVSFMRL